MKTSIDKSYANTTNQSNAQKEQTIQGTTLIECNITCANLAGLLHEEQKSFNTYGN